MAQERSIFARCSAHPFIVRTGYQWKLTICWIKWQTVHATLPVEKAWWIKALPRFV